MLYQLSYAPSGRPPHGTRLPVAILGTASGEGENAAAGAAFFAGSVVADVRSDRALDAQRDAERAEGALEEEIGAPEVGDDG